MSKNCHGHADTFPQNENNSYGYADSKGLKNGLLIKTWFALIAFTIFY
jgi:hypothetical protein